MSKQQKWVNKLINLFLDEKKLPLALELYLEFVEYYDSYF